MLWSQDGLEFREQYDVKSSEDGSDREILALDETHRPIPGWRKFFRVDVAPRNNLLWWVRAQPALSIYALTDQMPSSP